MKKQIVVLLLKYGLGLGLLAWVIWSYWDPDPSKGTGIKQALQRPIHWGPFFLAFLLAGVGVGITFVRWFLLVRAQNLPFTLPNAFRLGLVGFFFNTLFPGAVGGDIIKATAIAREQSRRTVAVATVLVDRIVGLCGLVLLTALFSGFFFVTGQLDELAATTTVRVVFYSILAGSWGICLGALVFWALLGWFSPERAEAWAGRLEQFPKIGGSLAELWRAGWMYRQQTRYVVYSLFLALAGHFLFVLMFYFCAGTLTPFANLPSLGIHFLLIPVGMTIEAGFPTPGGVGGGEAAYGELYAALHFDAALGVLGSLVKRCIYWILALMGYLVYLRMKPNIRRVEMTADPQTARNSS